MLTSTFIETINHGTEKPILFYIDDHQVPETYHISEIKKVQVESVDCGGKSHSWRENVFHIFIPNAPEQLRATITNNRLNAIFGLIGALDDQAEITVEYSRTLSEPLANYAIDRAEVTEEKITVFLAAKRSQCKPVTKGGCDSGPRDKKGCCG